MDISFKINKAMNKHHLYLISCLIFFLTGFSMHVTGQQKKFTVVIDAGHGGKDPGARGAFSDEKDINLSIALKVGEKIEKQNPDVNVLYTRKKDVYLTVAERPKYANDVHADLFISVHTNSSTNTTASGIETFTLGVARTKENLQVAMTENAVILLEDNYEQKYQGFDPNSVESYIMFEFMQDKYMEQSIQLASFVQSQCINNCNRKDRGVRQAGFLVLKNTAMPSILVEVGFISNPEEEKYLNSSKGVEDLSTSIYNGFITFKHQYDKKSNGSTASAVSTSAPTNIKPIKETQKVVADSTVEPLKSSTNQQKVYKVQLFASKDLLKSSDPRFKGLKKVTYYKENNIYKYTYGETTDYVEALNNQKEAKRYFSEAFIVSFVNGKRVK